MNPALHRYARHRRHHRQRFWSVVVILGASLGGWAAILLACRPW